MSAHDGSDCDRSCGACHAQEVADAIADVEHETIARVVTWLRQTEREYEEKGHDAARSIGCVADALERGAWKGGE